MVKCQKFKNFMKKYSLIVLSILILMPLAVLAQTASPITSVSQIPTLLNRIAAWISGIVFTVAVIMLLYAGLRYMTSAGDEKKSAEAKKTLVFGLIGLTIALFAFGAKAIITSIFKI